MKCAHCQTDLPDEAELCPSCGGVPTEPEESIETPIPSENAPEITADIPETPAEQSAPIEAETIAAYNPLVPSVPYTPCAPPPKKKGAKIAVIAITAALVIAAMVVFLYLQGADGRVVDEAQSLFYNGNYTEAINLLNSIEDPSSDTGRDIRNLKNEIYSAIGEDISKLIEQGKTDEALKMLKANEFIPSYDDLQNNICEAVEERIFALMDEGEYIKAQELLEENSFITGYDKLSRQIMYETMIIQCVFSLRPMMKNPTSLQITAVEIYDIDAEYPAFVMSESGQNGFGGYSSAYVVFSSTDLDYLGSCESVYDPDDDDYMEQLIALLIQTYREDEEEITDAPYDLARINAFIPSGRMPNIDFEQYKSEPDTTV